MVNGTQYLPDDLLPPSDHKPDVITFLALAHGDPEDSKRILLILQDEDDRFQVEADDVAAVTQDEPIESFQ